MNSLTFLKFFIIFSVICLIILFIINPQTTTYSWVNQLKNNLSESISTNVEPNTFLIQPLNNNVFNCCEKKLDFSFEISGKYFILNNFIKADRQFKCDETITLTVPADFRYLDNVSPLVDVWQGPISVALYAPGYDFFSTLNSIAFLRNCASKKVKEFVTFHIFFEYQYIEKVETSSLIEYYKDYFDCSKTPPFKNVSEKELFKTKNELLYPLNAARNVARKNAHTYFIFPSDIELFPTPNFINKFLEFAKTNIDYIFNGQRRVFVLPIFEIYADQKIPQNKTALQQMFKEKKAFWFHDKMCSVCHRVIQGDEWMSANETQGIGVFATGKRQKKFKDWEPFYVTTNEEPFFDERFTWEGESDKIIQAYTLCLLDYDFVILDNAFVVHKPGIKKISDKPPAKYKEIPHTAELKKTAKSELESLFGKREECS